MKKIKMIFPDGSIKEIDESDVQTAIFLGAKQYNEANGKKVSMQFPDGSVKEIDSADVAVGESLGGVKKKEAADGPLPLPNGTEITGQSLLPSTLVTEKVQQGIEDYNQRFESITGYRKFDLSAPAGQPGLLSMDNFIRRKKESEQKKYSEYRTAEEDINKTRGSAFLGSSSLADDLKNLSRKPYGLGPIRQIISEFGSVSPDVQDVSQIDYDSIAKNITEKNRKNGVEALENLDNQALSNIKKIQDSVKIITDVDTPISTPGGGALKEKYTATDTLPAIDFNDEKSVASAIRFLDDKGYLQGSSKESGYSIDNLRDDLQIVYKTLINSKPIDPQIESIKDKIGSAVTSHFMRSDKNVKPVINEGEVAEDYTDKINTQTQHFMAGLNYIKYLHPGTYKNVLTALKEKNEISARDYTQISRLGQDIVNENIFRKSGEDNSLIGAETGFDYRTKEERKAEIAGEIGELAKAKGYKDLEFSEKLVKSLGREIGYTGDDREITEELALEEGIGNYDAIPKTGTLNAFIKGVSAPIAGLGSTVKTWFFESPAETYLRSQKLDTGLGQKVPDQKGQYSAELASDRNNIWYDVIEGAAQFLPQIFLTKGIGSGLSKIAGAALSSVPRAALSAVQRANMVNYGGTLVSQFLQTYGDAYTSALQKTGNPGLSRLMGGIDATTTAFSELILPDVKIAEKAFSGLKASLINNIADVFKKGGAISELRKTSRPFLEKFISGFADISRQEVSEEVLSQWAGYLDEAIFSPNTVKDRDFAQETWDTIKGTAISMVLPSLFGAGGSAVNKDFSVQGLHSSSLNMQRSKDDLQAALNRGAITMQDYNNSIQLLNTHRVSLFTAPLEDDNDVPLSKKQVLEFAYQETTIKELKKELKNTDNTVQHEMLEGKIKRAEDVQRSILFKGEGVKKDSEKTEESGSGKIFTDFDDTLWDTKNKKLTVFGETIKEKIAAGEDVNILTARDATKENIDFISETLGIDQRKIQAGLTSQGKADFVVPGSTFYDNNDENLAAVSQKGGVTVVDSKTLNNSDEQQIVKAKVRSDEEIESILNPALIDQDGNPMKITTSQQLVPRNITDPVTGEDKMSLRKVKNRAESLKELINCLS